MVTIFQYLYYLKKTHTHTSQLTNQNKVVNFFLPTIKKPNRDVHISTPKKKKKTRLNFNRNSRKSILLAQ